MKLDIDGLAVTLLRKKIKNLNLRVKQNGDIQVSAPMKLPLNYVYQFLQEKRGWIGNHLDRLLQQQPCALTQTLSNGDTLFFLGTPYTLITHLTLKKKPMVMTETAIHIFVKPDTVPEQLQLLINQWYRQQMQLLLPELFTKWENMIGVQANQYGIRMMKTRWGSCNTVKKRIWLNLRLIQKPLKCLEYVIVHELVHLLEASHNSRFHALVSHFLPEWKQIKSQLES